MTGSNVASERRPLVSVVTPSYNAMPYIRETIESVRAQDYPRIQHIVVDGNSSDGTQEMLKRCTRIKWVSEPDKGQSDALNKGFRMAEGEIIGWLNADDTYCPGAVSFGVDYLEKHPEVDLIYTDILFIDENDKPIRLAQGEPFSLEGLLYVNMVRQPSLFMRRKVIEDLGGVRDDLHLAMDRELWLRAGMTYRFEYLPGVVLANFRFCKGTKSFEHLPDFHMEWIKYLEGLPSGSKLRERIKPVYKKVMKFTWRSYYLASMMRSSSEGKTGEVLVNFFRGVSSEWAAMFQAGVWKLLAREMIRSFKMRRK